jgi:tocopherol O-methyltransferase
LATTIEASLLPRPRAELIAYYDAKTAAILERYGPGPRVHYHTGLIDAPVRVDVAARELRQMLIASQERMLAYAAGAWDASKTLSGEVLDVGCGLGGGALFWAQEYGADVTALTCVPCHAELVMRFARMAGVEKRVHAWLGDAVAMPGMNCFDAAVAVDSSGYLERTLWMRQIAKLLRPHGRLFIIDCFLGRKEYQTRFNRHWHTRIGTLDEYLGAAQRAGLSLVSLEEVSALTQPFWSLTIALIQQVMRSSNGRQQARLARSLRMHRFVHEGLGNGGLHYLLMSLRK